MKNYYEILGVGEDAPEDEIKRAYKALAFEYHPDRNGGSKRSEERFKQITEAYAVLADAQNRRRYDAARASRSAGAGARPGDAGFAPEDLFRDIFGNPEYQRIFTEMANDFKGFGFRFDQEFIRRILMAGGPMRPVIFGGVFFGAFSPWLRRYGGAAARRSFETTAGTPGGILGKAVRFAGRKAGGLLKELLLGGAAAGQSPPASPGEKGRDLNFTLELSLDEAARGVEKTIAYRDGDRRERLLVKIPPGAKDGSKLRLRGKGCSGERGRPPGDLYINVRIES